ncbi:hypothetical protein [Lysobacter sp. Hz 25]|uniref:hypothetical protein n=1 Tax=Lysobacter sp. Hz 25 TaxID=3383698 RepID=UPI0038D3E9A8
MKITIFGCERLTLIYVAGESIGGTPLPATAPSAMTSDTPRDSGTDLRTNSTAAGDAEWAELLRKLAGGCR